MEDKTSLFNDMKLSCENGAKYIVIFDSNENHTENVLTSDHLDAIKDFWQYTKDHPRTPNTSKDRVCFVLPEAYGYGFRGPDDSIWGLWSADGFSKNLTIAVGQKLNEYGEKLDLVYNQTQLLSAGYGEIFF
jgi:hypothetical protein